MMYRPYHVTCRPLSMSPIDSFRHSLRIKAAEDYTWDYPLPIVPQRTQSYIMRGFYKAILNPTRPSDTEGFPVISQKPSIMESLKLPRAVLADEALNDIDTTGVFLLKVGAIIDHTINKNPNMEIFSGCVRA